MKLSWVKWHVFAVVLAVGSSIVKDSGDVEAGTSD